MKYLGNDIAVDPMKVYSYVFVEQYNQFNLFSIDKRRCVPDTPSFIPICYSFSQ